METDGVVTADPGRDVMAALASARVAKLERLTSSRLSDDQNGSAEARVMLMAERLASLDDLTGEGKMTLAMGRP